MTHRGICAGCKRSYRVPEKLLGRTMKCPACGDQVTVAVAEASPPVVDEDDFKLQSEFERPGMNSGSKKCPHCSRDVTSQAVICIHCGWDFRAGRLMSAFSARSTSDLESRSASPSQTESTADGGEPTPWPTIAAMGAGLVVLLALCVWGFLGVLSNPAVGGHTAAEWVGKLNHRKESAEAEESLRKIGKKAVPALIEGFTSDPSPTVRIKCAVLLGELGSGAAEAVEPLTKGISDSQPKIREACAQSLIQLGSEAQSAVPALARLAREQGIAQSHAVAVLRGIGDPESKDVFLEHLQSVAAKVKSYQDGKSDALYRELALRSDLIEIRRDCIAACGSMGMKEAIPVLIILSDDPSASSRAAVLSALTQIGEFTPDVVECAVAAVRKEGEDPGVRKLAIALLAQAGSQPAYSQRIVAQLSNLLADAQVVGDIAEALGMIGRPAASSLPALRTAKSKIKGLAKQEYDNKMSSVVVTQTTTTTSTGEVLRRTPEAAVQKAHDSMSNTYKKQADERWAAVEAQIDHAISIIEGAG